jgi:SAM-dependent methyltransferase
MPEPSLRLLTPMALHDLIFRFTRPRRMRWFAATLAPAADTHIVDVGGRAGDWQYLETPAPVTLVNLDAPPDRNRDASRLRFVTGDGCALPFPDGSIPIVFSNSVIEHVGGPEAQARFAAELRRVGRKLWVQTPAWIFPVEPHVIALALHWLPASWYRRLVRRWSLWGWYYRPTQPEAEAFLDRIHLLTHADMVRLFPDCEILVERWMLWPKSYIAVRR